jgi:hypothetical protein
VRLGIPLQDHADELRGDATPCEIEQAARDLLKIADDSTFEREWNAL